MGKTDFEYDNRREYLAKYHEYYQKLVDEYVDGGGFDETYERIVSQIGDKVRNDPTAFYTYDEFETAHKTLYDLVKRRAQSIKGQLDGTIPSTDDAQSGSDALIDASDIDTSVMGSMFSGDKGMGEGRKGMRPGGMAPPMSESEQEEVKSYNWVWLLACGIIMAVVLLIAGTFKRYRK